MTELPVLDLGRIVADVKDIQKRANDYNTNLKPEERVFSYQATPWYTAIFLELNRLGLPAAVTLSKMPYEELKGSNLDDKITLVQVGLHTREFGYEIIGERFHDTLEIMHIPLVTGKYGGSIVPIPLKKEDNPEEYFFSNVA